MEDIKEVKPEVINQEIKKANQEVEPEKHTSDKALIISIAIILIIIAVIVSFKLIPKEQPQTIEELHLANLKAELNSDQGYTYNGYSFVFANGLWYTQVQNIAGTSLFNIPLHFGPNDLEDVSIEGEFNAEIFNSEKGIYVTFDPLGQNLQYVALAVAEFDQSIIQAFNKIPIAACDKNETIACQDRPIITCNTTNKPTLYLQQEPEAKIIYQDNCIIVQGQMQEIIKAIDRLLLMLYNIMP